MKSTSHGTSSWRIRSDEEEHGALEHADQHQVLAGVVAGDVRRQLAHPPLEVLGRDEDLPDRVVASTLVIL